MIDNHQKLNKKTTTNVYQLEVRNNIKSEKENKLSYT